MTALLKESGADANLQKLIDDLKDVLSKTWNQEKRKAIIEAIRDLERFDGPVTEAELARLEAKISQQLGTNFAALVRQPVIDVTEAAYLMGMQEVARQLDLAPFGVNIRWNLPDLEALDVLTQNTLFWIGDYYNSQVQDRFKAVLQEFFHGGYNRDQIAEMLEETFADLGPRTKEYWDLLADHTCTKVREIGRVSAYDQAGIEALEIRAWLDSRTTPICRSLHGRIITLRQVRRFVDNYLEACKTGDKETVKQAWPMWQNKEFQKAGIAALPSGKLVARGVGLPPYHFRCRTITVPYFELLDERRLNLAIQGQEVVFWDGVRTRKDTIAYEYMDKLGRKTTITHGCLAHIARHGISENRLLSGLNSIIQVGSNAGPEAAGEAVYLTHNKLVIFLRGNVVMSAYQPGRRIDRYFRDITEPGSRFKV